MTMTLPKPRRSSGDRVTLTLLPSSYRTFRTSWLERGLRVACHGQIGNELVAVVVQQEQLFLLRGHRRMHISGLAVPDLQRLLGAPSESAYTSVRVALTPCEDSSPVAPSGLEADLPVCPLAVPAEEGGQRFINQTAVTIKPRRQLVLPTRPDAGAPAAAPAKDRSPQVFRRPAGPISR